MASNKGKKTGNREVFEGIKQGLKEAIDYLDGKPVKARTYTFKKIDSPNIKSIRKKLGMTQEVFAQKFGFPKSTLRNWEQGTRTPDTTARILLTIIDKEPKLVEKILRQ